MEGVECPWLRRRAEAVNPARVIASRWHGVQQCPGHPGKLAGDRELLEPLTQCGNKEELRTGIWPEMAQARRAAAKRLQQPKVIEPPKAGGAETLELREHPLGGGRRHRRAMRAYQSLGLRLKRERELILEPDRAQQPKGVVDEDLSRDGSQDSAPKIV